MKWIYDELEARVIYSPMTDRKQVIYRAVNHLLARIFWKILLFISTLPKNQADGDKWLVTEIINSTFI